MRAIHAWWSKPALWNNSINDKQYIIDDKLLLPLILSALYWKKYNGTIELYTDTTTVRFFKKIGLLKLNIWDYIDTEVHDNIPEQINPTMFWAANKFYVYKQLKPPFLMLDTDAFFTKTVDWPTNVDLLYAHREKCLYPHYPDPNIILKDKKLLKRFPWKSDAINASALLFNSKKLLKDYTNTATNYIEKEEHNIKTTLANFGNNILVVEQRLLAEIVDNNNYRSKPILNNTFYNYEYKKAEFVPPENEQCNAKDTVEYYHHVWGEKVKVYSNYQEYIKYMEKYLKYLKDDFPEQYDDIVKVLVRVYKMSKPIKSTYKR